MDALSPPWEGNIKDPPFECTQSVGRSIYGSISCNVLCLADCEPWSFSKWVKEKLLTLGRM